MKSFLKSFGTLLVGCVGFNAVAATISDVTARTQNGKVGIGYTNGRGPASYYMGYGGGRIESDFLQRDGNGVACLVREHILGDKGVLLCD